MRALKKALQEASSKAQVAINILVRNLFERTADIGFLACDEDIGAFLRLAGDASDRQERLGALRSRFDEYVRKYSVYSDVILLNPNGNVVARLDDTGSTTVRHDPIVREAMTTAAGYVERFGETDLVSERAKALIYGFRVVDHNGVAIGALCLLFRFDNEMELIFSNLVGKDAIACDGSDDGNLLVVLRAERLYENLSVPGGPVIPPAASAEPGARPMARSA